MYLTGLISLLTGLISVAYRLDFSVYRPGIDFKCPYSNRPLKPSTPLIGLWQGSFSGT
jgi:hypothetical protein